MALMTRGVRPMLFGISLVGVLGLWGILWSTSLPQATAADPEPGSAVAAAAVAPLSAGQSLREVVAQDEDVAPAVAAPRGYDEVYVDIIASLLHGAGLAQRQQVDDGSIAEASKRSGDLFGEMCTRVEDAGPRTLQKMLGFASDWKNPELRRDLYACQVILELRLRVMSDMQGKEKVRQELVGSMLDAMLVTEDVAMVMFDLLRRRPYVEPLHEPSLVALVDAATGSLAYLRPMANELLMDLWLRMDDRNADLLALCDGHAGAASQRAALARLVCSDRYREFAMDRIKASADIVCMNEAAMLAARRLDAQTAISIVQTLKSTPAAELQPISAYNVLADRFPDELGESYQDALARGVMPAHRENAMQSLAFLPDGKWLDFAKRAFDSDDSKRVRGVCLLALAQLPSEEFARYFDVLVADTTFLLSPQGPSYLAAAIGNHAPRCQDPNFLDRASNTLLSILPSGARQARQSIEDLRRQYIPH